MDKTIAVIGTGRWGSKIITALKKLNIKVVCCNTTGVYQDQECFDDWINMLSTRPDGVIIAANPALNLAIMQRANLLNIPVMVEKPVAFYLSDIHKMEKLKIPILVNYIHLFNPYYQAMKHQIKSNIVRIGSIGYNYGPFRHFSSLFDYGPHDLAMAMDLVHHKFQVINSKVKQHKTSGGRLYHLTLKAGPVDVDIITGNGGDERVRKLVVFCQDGSIFKYEDDGTSEKPLENAILEFVKVINGAKPMIPFSLTSNIHKTLFDLGNKWEKEKR